MDNKTEQFIERARKVHGDKYDYSEVEYVDMSTKVKIICPEHGSFLQTPQRHVSGAKCPKCAHQSYVDTVDSFVEKARKVHGDKYDYSKVEYKNSHTKVCIICPKHGEFWQIPTNHLRGQGCPSCGNERISQKRKSNLQEFVKRAIKVHGEKYDYSKVEYLNNFTKVCIICPEHGEFWQIPNGHLSGKGCRKCKQSKLERILTVYFDAHEIKYQHDTHMPFLGRQHLDFYLPDYNVGIECQGEQHLLREMKYKYSKRTLEDQIALDKKKNALCKEHGVRLLYFVDQGVLRRSKVIPDFYENCLFTELEELIKNAVGGV